MKKKGPGGNKYHLLRALHSLMHTTVCYATINLSESDAEVTGSFSVFLTSFCKLSLQFRYTGPRNSYPFILPCLGKCAGRGGSILGRTKIN